VTSPVQTPDSEPLEPTALEQLASDPSSRKRFLRALGGGAAAATFSLALAACGGSKSKVNGNQFGGAGVGTAQFGQGDVGILNYALALEYIETDFYRAAVKSGKLSGSALELAKRFGEEEQAHVTTLEGTIRNLGGKPTERHTTSFPLANQAGILKTAAAIEGVGAAAYLGQVDRIQSKQVLAAALSIHSVEARHAGALAMLNGAAISPDGPFAVPATSTEVSQLTVPYITS
jgi:rubrerythrin